MVVVHHSPALQELMRAFIFGLRREKVIESHPSQDLEQSSGKTRVYVSTSTRSTKQKVLDSWSEYGLQLCAVNAPGHGVDCLLRCALLHTCAVTLPQQPWNTWVAS